MRILAAASSNGAPGPRLTPPSKRFTTIVGQPKTIALKYATGKPTRTGNVMYSLTNGETAFFPPHVAAAIDSLTLAPGQPLTVCHLGGEEWDIDRAAAQAPAARGQEPVAEPAPVPPAASATRTPAPQPPRYWGVGPPPETADSTKTAKEFLAECARNHPERMYRQSYPPPRSSGDGDGTAKVNGAGEDAETVFARNYARCYTTAIAITVRALEDARQKGLQLLPTHEGLQACAATLFIAENKAKGLG